MKREQYPLDPAAALLPALLLVFFGTLVSCGTMQKDIHISSIDEAARTDLVRLEETIVTLESAPRNNSIAEARRTITSLSTIPDTE
jgi:hypothetical protein